MSRQLTDTVMMVRPASFGYNEQTALNNSFQNKDESLTQQEIKLQAQSEFDAFVGKLRANKIEVVVMEDSLEPKKPDAIFPNNWVSFHDEGKVILYPMFAPNRRLERQDSYISALAKSKNIDEIHHLENNETEERFLEGTGSMILDRQNKIVYACLSPRTDKELLLQWCGILGYKPVVFHSVDKAGDDIYHTNVMMALGNTFAIICLESIPEDSEVNDVIQVLKETGKEIIEIDYDQMNHFAGNMLQLQGKDGSTHLVMSEQAFRSLREFQIRLIRQHTNILYAPLYTIEKYGGGSARCMIAEVFLPDRS